MKPLADHPTSPEKLISDPADFSLVLGGPLYQLLRRSRLSGDALELVRKRIVVIALLAWLPLLLLSALEGQLLDGGVAIPFLMDFDVHIRFLVAMPLLIGAELIVHQRIRPVVGQFLDRRLVPEAARARFEAAVASTMRLRNSVTAEVLLIAFVYGFGVLVVWRNAAVLDTATWYTVPTDSGFDLSLAGIWYGYVSVPIFQFLLLRWFFRTLIWMRFLWQVSRIELNLVPTHPDRVGGLGFLANSAYAFMPLALAYGALLAGMLANRIFYVGATLPEFKAEIAMVVIFVECLVLAPLFVFSTQLANAKRIGLREYGGLAMTYVREFDSKWLRGGAPADEPLVGSGDIQSLADLGNSFAVVQEMRLAPVTRDVVLRLSIATLLPVVPLLLTIMPLEELLNKLAGIIL
ncbi:hypothetical protein KRX52_19860 [Pseudomonas sp. MAP12]|uniref:Uncharacterized protein n=1 Tax=Geopseudomonas aromaticivorans TaxID=2849492 RepID=A0ABS6N3E0_9GAMM|nr:hypothetical protein [Pseudomonas aromaticivorans]MBV2135032.1 hypothetical protein [Pseudomonas aromaticivorans]